MTAAAMTPGTGLDGLADRMLLFAVGAGLALIFGVMDVLNLAHGSLYLAGAYLASAVTGADQAGFAVAVLAGVAAGAGQHRAARLADVQVGLPAAGALGGRDQPRGAVGRQRVRASTTDEAKAWFAGTTSTAAA
jgi:ABC-type branched-subunit amino acid transport system permease subunit